MLLARAHQHAAMLCHAPTRHKAQSHMHMHMHRVPRLALRSCTPWHISTAACPQARVRKLMRGSGRCARRTRRSWGFFRKFECPLLPKFEVRSQLMATAAAYAYALPSRPLPPCTYERPLVGLRRLACSMLLALGCVWFHVRPCLRWRLARVCMGTHMRTHRKREHTLVLRHLRTRPAAHKA